MTWPQLPTQPDGAEPVPLSLPPEPWTGEELPPEVLANLREREVPRWFARAIGNPARRDTDPDRWGAAGMLAAFGGLFMAPFLAGTGAPIAVGVVGAILLAGAAVLLVGVPLYRRRRLGQARWLLTTERFGVVWLDGRQEPRWVERARLGDVDVLQVRKDGSGTLRVASRPDRYGTAPGPLRVGRIPDVREAAERIRMLGRDLS